MPFPVPFRCCLHVAPVPFQNGTYPIGPTRANSLPYPVLSYSHANCHWTQIDSPLSLTPIEDMQLVHKSKNKSVVISSSLTWIQQLFEFSSSVHCTNSSNKGLKVGCYGFQDGFKTSWWPPPHLSVSHLQESQGAGPGRVLTLCGLLHMLRHFDPHFSGLWKICIVLTPIF